MSKHPDPESFAVGEAEPLSEASANLPAPAALPAAPATPATDPARWTREKQVAFLGALASSHNVSAAARSVGMSRQSAYRLRARLRGEPFDLAWDAAFQCCFDGLAEAALERAMHRVEVPHYHKGELVGTSRRFDERLTVALLAMRESFLRPPPPHWHTFSAYEADDFRGLLDRVERGPDTWEEERERERAEWGDDDEDWEDEDDAEGENAA